MKSSKDERKSLKDENKILKAAICSIESSLESVTRVNNDRRSTLAEKEETNNIVKDVAKPLGVDITENDISVSHRMSQSQKHKGKPGPPAIIVKFTRPDVKDNFYRARKQLK
ncbi:hypothetical protein P5673_027005 [Acropora cervicornis]|uniref:Uncharacterized protein n=1 Tax=Acropora cervicornis TaxID=6130 RepID=A0AAD9PZN1_ACRCE|nr:hypothetical protein P5673_027005 [Acropora cervicornis]